MLSIVVPVLDEARAVARHLASLEPLRRRGTEVIVADGGSADGTAGIARPLADIVVQASRGRAAQMNAGAAAAQGDLLLFLHADTLLPDEADRLVTEALGRSERVWGRFDVRIAGRHPLLPVIATMMNHRSRLTGIATGDQAMFMTRRAFAAAGGFPDISLMEDISLSRALKRLGRPVCLTARVTTSGRRWEERGVLATMLLMWRLRTAFALGADPAELALRYGYRPR